MSHNQEISIKLAEGVYSIGKPEGNFYSLVVISDEGVAIIDPARKAHAKILMEEIKKLTTQPIKYLFCTHNHWDHTKGGQLFKEAGAS